MTAPSFLAWVPAVAAAATAAPVAGTFTNNGGPGDTISDTTGDTALVVDSYTVNVGDRILVADQAASYQNGVYVASTIETSFGQVATITLSAGGTGYTPGQYYNLTTTTSGSGTALLVDVTVSSAGVVTAISVAQLYVDAPGETPAGTNAVASGVLAGGSGYAVADTVVPVGIGAGTGLTAVVATLQPSYVLTRAEDANVGQQFSGMSVFVAGGTVNVGKAFVQTNGAVTLDVVSQISGTGAITQPTALQPWFPIVDGTYTNVPLVSVSNVSLGDGDGINASATVVVASGAVSSVTVTQLGSGYTNGEVVYFGNYAGVSVIPGAFYGLGTGGAVVVNTSVPASSAVTFVQFIPA